MASTVADILNSGPVPLARVRDDARRILVALLDAVRRREREGEREFISFVFPSIDHRRRPRETFSTFLSLTSKKKTQSPGRKTLVIEPAIAIWLGLMAEVPLLKEHGVDQLLLLGENGAPRLTSPSSSSSSSSSTQATAGGAAVVFVARARPAAAAAIAACVVAASSASSSSSGSRTSKKPSSSRPREFRALFAPRVTESVRTALVAGGALGSVSLSPLRAHFLPVEPDVLSLEDPGAFADSTRLGCGYGGESGRAAAAGGDPRPARDFASGLVALARSNSLLGVPRVIRGVGPAASVVRAALDLSRRGADAEVADADEERTMVNGDDSENDAENDDSLFPAPGTGRITEWLVIDRVADPVTPLATQLTYEGLVRETVEVRAGAAFIVPEPAPANENASPSSPHPTAAAPPARVPLSAGDLVFRDLRDACFAAAGPSLGARAREIQQGYQAARGGSGGGSASSSSAAAAADTPASPSSKPGGGASLSELRALAGSLKALPSIQRHVALAEAVGAAANSPLFRGRMEAEQRLLTLTGVQQQHQQQGAGSTGGGAASALLGAVVGVGGDGGAASSAAAAAAEAAVDAAEAFLIREGSPKAVDSALRLLCLATVAAGGIPKRRWEACRREVLLTAGPEAAAALVGLERAGLLRCAGGVSGVASSSGASGLPPPMPPAVLPPAAFVALRRYLRLVCDPGEDPRNPRDASYVYAGFCPISSRLASAAAAAASSSSSSSSSPSSSSSSSRSWAHLPGMAESLKALPQPCFEVELGTAADGSPSESPLLPSPSTMTSTSRSSNNSRAPSSPSSSLPASPRRILVCFVGGCTHAEVSALRWLSASAAGRAAVAALGSSGGGGSGGGGARAAAAAAAADSSSSSPSSSALPEFQFVIATSAMLTGDDLMRSFDPPAVTGLKATVAAV